MPARWRELRGVVRSGQGDFGHWLTRLKDHYRAKTGMDFFPGTLNVHLNEAYVFPPDALRLDKDEYGGLVSVRMTPCRIFGRAGYILRTEPRAGVEPADPCVLEVATDLGLRAAYGLKDGDLVSVEVPVASAQGV